MGEELAVGVEVEIENKEWNAYLVATHDLDYDIAFGGWVGDYLDPLTFLEMWSPGNGNNNTGWNNPTFAKLLQQSCQESDATRRFEREDIRLSGVFSHSCERHHR